MMERLLLKMQSTCNNIKDGRRYWLSKYFTSYAAEGSTPSAVTKNKEYKGYEKKGIYSTKNENGKDCRFSSFDRN